jgi:hypothetical protein|tara:strand:+ start:1477 stop:1827 length:351 start_codon:yes stop_codon:yes gene_type:complete
MPQKYWESGRDGKHLGWDDISAMGIQELLEHLKRWYDVTDIKPTIDITDFNRPPWSLPGDPYIHNALECWNDASDEWGANKNYEERTHFHLSIMIKRKDVIQHLTAAADGDFAPTW